VVVVMSNAIQRANVTLQMVNVQFHRMHQTSDMQRRPTKPTMATKTIILGMLKSPFKMMER
jgi:hypothetical protein